MITSIDTIRLLQGTLAKRSKLSLQPNFAKELATIEQTE